MAPTPSFSSSKSGDDLPQGKQRVPNLRSGCVYDYFSNKHKTTWPKLSDGMFFSLCRDQHPEIFLQLGCQGKIKKSSRQSKTR